MEDGQIVNEEVHHIGLLDNLHLVGLGGAGQLGDGVAGDGRQMEAIALAQVAGAEHPLLRVTPTVIGDVEGVDVAVVVQIVGAIALGQAFIEDVFAILTQRRKEENAQANIVQGLEFPGDFHICREVLRAPEHIISCLAQFRVSGADQMHSAVFKCDSRLSFQDEAFNVFFTCQRIIINQLFHIYTCPFAWFSLYTSL